MGKAARATFDIHEQSGADLMVFDPLARLRRVAGHVDIPIEMRHPGGGDVKTSRRRPLAL
jgi:hypothetical protein